MDIYNFEGICSVEKVTVKQESNEPGDDIPIKIEEHPISQDLKCEIKSESAFLKIDHKEIPAMDTQKNTNKQSYIKDVHIKDEIIFICELCEEVFVNEVDLENHKSTHVDREFEEDEVENAFVCSVCDDIFSNKEDLIAHKNITPQCHEHRSCEKCGGESVEEFTCIWELIDHAKARHGLIDEDGQTEIQDPPQHLRDIEAFHVTSHQTHERTQAVEEFFAQDWNQKLNERIHVGERIYSCIFPPDANRKTHENVLDDQWNVKNWSLGTLEVLNLADENDILMTSSKQVGSPTNENCQAKDTKSEVQEFLNTKDADIVDYVLEKQFRSFSYKDKVLIKSIERPCPVVEYSSSAPNKISVATLYEKFDWLAGSKTRNQLLCWRCTLFGDESTTPWVTPGCDNPEELTSTLEHHEMTKDHIQASVKFVLFGKQNNQPNLVAVHNDDIRKFNEKVRENRDIMKRLVDLTICSAGFQGGVHNLAKFLSSYDETFKKVLDESAFPKTIQSDLAKNINAVVAQRIASELRQAPCFSWQLDVTASIHHVAQLSIVVRYAFQGQIKKRFLSLHDASELKTANALFDLLMDKFGHVEMERKLVGQSYDGLSVQPSEISELITRIRSVAPQALLVHNQAHELNSVLQDVTSSSIGECETFFASLYGFSSLFSNANRKALLDRICRNKFPGCAEANLDFESRLTKTVLVNRASLIESLEYMLASPEFDRDEEALRSADGLLDLLGDFEFLFLLNTFDFIFDLTDCVVLKNCASSIQHLMESLKCFRSQGHFEEIYQRCACMVEPPSKKRKTNFSGYEDGSAHYKRVFNEITDLIIEQIRLRFQNLERLQFLDLLDHTKFAQYKEVLPHRLLDNLIDIYSNMFDKQKLLNQLKVLYSEPDILGDVTDLSHMLHFIYDNSLETVISEIHKLLSLILTLPVTPTSSAQTTSVIKRIKSFLKHSNTQESLICHSIIVIEKKLVDELANYEATFYDDIINNFAEAENYYIDLKYKAM